ncbi:hypothetical protein D3C81_807820 [compost metagenome]
MGEAQRLSGRIVFAQLRTCRFGLLHRVADDTPLAVEHMFDFVIAWRCRRAKQAVPDMLHHFMHPVVPAGPRQSLPSSGGVMEIAPEGHDLAHRQWIPSSV